ncbi:hypothetical protein F991_01208 [Acinetobacter sp. CIP-A165]|uniref:hypothetical protein n=1 Tax=Acinetobacter sp. CIP-A165 TaxID=40373 RepID=UPI0002D00496|nr:hypothetical protein [Acinetobacter sp. CIP-A165]ENU30865.1 hypothetical protein F991_01208 [Acinetobacter sp. CIP-A165]
MKDALPTTSGLSKFIIFSVFVWLVLLYLQSSYIVIIGGSAYLFWTSLGLLLLNLLSFRPSTFKNRTALLFTTLLLIYLALNSLFCTYLILAFYCIFYLYSGNYRYKKLIKLAGLFLILIVFALYQAQSLHELKEKYAPHETGETWQQYGAL